ncbi:LOW QUALITY PROTEIN: helicase POLQ-like [Babylonia areolata]|uniref:LOW QUALITY PROTEIN: helicase POLQ-like n=1 Tax=Babylonia areolata TaxID=304850 RepID=UPI003FD42211
MISEGDSLISRRNRHTAKKRSLDTEGIDSQSAHREKCCRAASTDKNDLNNSDIWLAEMVLPSDPTETSSSTAPKGYQEELHSVTLEHACTFSRSVDEDQSGNAAVQRKQSVCLTDNIQKQNRVSMNGTYCDQTKPEMFLPSELSERKMSSPAHGKYTSFHLSEDYDMISNNEESASLTDNVNFSGDADLFEDSFTEYITKDRLSHAESSVFQGTGVQEQETDHSSTSSHHKKTDKESVENSPHEQTDSEKNDRNHYEKANQKTIDMDICSISQQSDMLYSQTHGSVPNQTELKTSFTDSFPDCKSDQVDTDLTEPPLEITRTATPKTELGTSLTLHTSRTETQLGTNIVTPRTQVNTDPPKTTPKAQGLCLKDRLKNRLLQNASKVMPAANKLEEIRKESIAKAMLEASQIRRQGFVDGIGPFYGLPSKVQELLTTNRKITKLYDWQDECLKLPALYEGKNLIYTLPTSGGKTLVAEILILQQLLCKKKNALLVLPYISIVQEKVRILSEFATELSFLVEEYAGSKGRFPPTKRRQKQTLFVATIEKGQSLVNSLLEAGRLAELGLVVVDELHMIGEGGSRGSAMESCLIKLLNGTEEPPQVIGMSATLNNIGDLAKFLDAEVFSSDFRPVSLTEYVKVGDNLYQVNNKALVPEDKLEHDKILTFTHNEESQQMDPDHLLHLVLEIVPDNSCLLFCPTKRHCENVALMLAKMMCKQHRHLTDVHKEKRKALLRELHSDGGGNMCPTLKYTVHFGLAYHHSGLTTDERRLIEDAYSDGVLCLLTCTSTLAAGVNLPAKRVILRSPYVGADFIKHTQYKQMTGRAGRAGIDSSGESILIAKKADMPKVVELLSGPQDVCHSSLMYQSGKGLRSLILSLIGLKVVDTTQLVYTVVQKTLLAIQASRLGVDIITAIRQALQDLIDSGLVVQKKASEMTSQDQADLVALDKGMNSEELSGVSRISDSKEGIPVPEDSDSQDLFEEEGCSRKRMQTDDAAAGSLRKRMQTDAAAAVSVGEESSQPQQGRSLCGEVCVDVSDSLSGYTLEVTERGRATFKGSVDIQYERRLYEDLTQGEHSLVLANHLHLLYLVTPYELAQDITPCWMTYLHQLGTLAADEMRVASLIGITESYIVRKASGRSARQQVDPVVVQRFYLTLMLYELWKQFTVWDVAERFQLTRGFVQNLLSSASSFASCVLRFCQELPEFWAYQDLLGNFAQRLTYCVTMELLPLMEVPGVKLGRARQLYAAGYHTLQSLAVAEPAELVSKIQFLTRKAARQIVCAAKVMLEEKTDALLEQVEQLVPLPPRATPSSPHNNNQEHT